MTSDYLKKARASGLNSDSPYTEAELLESREEVREAWEALMEVRKEMQEAKLKALSEVDAEFAEKLGDAEANYAIMLSLAR